MGNGIPRELCKRVKSDPTSTGIYKNQNETHKIFWDFAIQTDQSIPTRRAEFGSINKTNNLPSRGFSEPRSGYKRKRKDREIMGPCQKTKNAVEYEGDCCTNYCWRPWNCRQKLVRKTRGIENQRKNQDHLLRNGRGISVHAFGFS